MREGGRTLRLRDATPADADALADLHTRSWRSAYRGSLAEAYLSGPIEAERRSFWRQRYDHPPHGLWTVIAEDAEGTIQGFLCLLADHDPQWGTLIDNVHDDPAHKGQGLGRAMMRAAGQHLLYALPRRPVYLFVLQENRGAIAFYDRIGGEQAERLVKTEPDGSQHPVFRYAWPSVAAFVEGIA